jgi:hypothetical protein
MKQLKEVGVKIDKSYADSFKSRCASYGISMAAVMKPAIDEFMLTHPQKTTVVELNK